MSSTTSGRRSANSAVSSSRVSRWSERAFSIARGATSSAIVTSRRRPEPLRGMNDQYLSLIVSSTPCATQSWSMYCG
jgi:hypothetical protein